MSGKRDLPYDQAVRTGTFVRGTKVVYSRIEIGAIPRRAKVCCGFASSGRTERRQGNGRTPCVRSTVTGTGGSPIA